MIPKIIHFTVPAKSTRRQDRNIAKAVELHPTWRVIVWKDPIDPAEFRLADFWPKVNSGAQLADLVRLEVVHNHGGVYLDSDVVLRKPLDDLADNLEFFYASEDGALATNAVFGAAKQHPALVQMIDDLRASPPDWTASPVDTTGPQFFSRILKWRDDASPVPRESFYPYNFHEEPIEACPHSYGVHEWEGSWKPSVGIADGGGSLARLAPARVASAAYRKLAAAYRSSELAIQKLSPRVYALPMDRNILRTTIHGHSILLDGSDVSITPEVARQGYYELREELFVRRCVRGGDFFVDVGANVGVFSLLAGSLVKSFGRVFAYEPNPPVAELLRKSSVMNWMHDRIVVRQAAVGACSGEAVLQVNPGRLGDASVRAANAFDPVARTTSVLPGSHSMTVPVVALDTEFPYDIPIKCLKVDAEGVEPEVLAGAQRLLQNRCVEYLIVEAIPEIAGTQWQRLLGAIRGVCTMGYAPFTLVRDGLLEATTLERIGTGKGLQTRNVVLKRVAR